MPRLPWSCQCNAEWFYFQRTNPSSFHANHLKRLRACCNVRWSIWLEGFNIFSCRMHKSTNSKCYHPNSQFERHSVLERDKIIFAKLSDYHSVLERDKIIFAKLSGYHNVLERDKIIFAKLSHYHSVLERDQIIFAKLSLISQCSWER